MRENELYFLIKCSSLLWEKNKDTVCLADLEHTTILTSSVRISGKLKHGRAIEFDFTNLLAML